MPTPIFQTRPARNRPSSSSSSSSQPHHSSPPLDDDTSSAPLSVSESQSKIATFQHFITAKLKPDLATTLQRRDALYTTTAQYVQLRHNLQHLIASNTKHFTARVDVSPGCDAFVRAEVDSTEVVCVEVGLGFRVEMGLGEAVAVCEAREAWLERRAEVLTERASVISAHIKLVYEGIAELMKVQDGPNKRQNADRGMYG